MDSNKHNNLPSVSVWQANLFRLTAFPSPDANLATQNWWSDIVGEMPESRTTQPRSGEQVDLGHYNEQVLLLQVHSSRINWLYTAELIDGNVAALSSFGTFIESISLFRSLMDRWLKLENCPPLDRLAFGATLLQPVENVVESYQRLSSYLPFSIDAEHSSDFAYQINRRRDSVLGIPKLKINRLSKWSTSVLRQGLVSFSLTAQPTLFDSTDLQYACTLELDINTIPEFKSLPREHSPALLGELLELGEEIAANGDIA